MAVFAAHVIVGAGIQAPFMFHDEAGYAGVARLLVGEAPVLGGPSYHPGYGVLLAPFAAVLDSGDLVTAAHLLNAMMAAALVPVLHALGRRTLGLGPWASAAAAVAAAVSSRSLLQSGMLLPESAFVLTTALTALALARSTRERNEPPRVVAAVGSGLLAAVAFALHPRGLVVVLAVVLAHLVAWRRGAGTPWSAGAASCAALTLSGAAALLAEWSADRLHPLGAEQAFSAGVVEDPTTLAGVPVIAAGQLWYLLAATLGLAGVGLVVAAVAAVRPRSDRTGTVAVFVALGFLGSLTLASLTSAHVPFRDALRADLPIYGRYVEQWGPLLVVFAVAGTAHLARRAAVVVAAVGLGTGALLADWYPASTWTGRWAWHNASAVRAAWERVGEDLVWASTGVAVTALAAVAVAPTRFRRGVVVAALVPMVALNASSGATLATRWAERHAAAWDGRHDLGGSIVASGVPVVAETTDFVVLFAAMNLQFWEPAMSLVLVDDLDDRPEGALILARRVEPVDDAELVAVDPGDDLALWWASDGPAPDLGSDDDGN